MRLEYQILSAVVLDLALGDPRWLPHPVRGIGWLAVQCESIARRVFSNVRLAGIVAVLAVCGITGAAAWTAIHLAACVHPLVGDVVAILVIYTSIAARDLARHSTTVFEALSRGNLADARVRVAAIVGRDTARLDEPEIVRAAVESVAESTVDGVTAPLFFAIVAGPLGAIVYRAINTLDSMFGHRDQRYREFGWAAARLDDLANYVPARLTAPLVCMAAMLLGQRPAGAVRILARDGRNHDSPNSGLTEAAMAGALGVQLGGTNHYDGQPLEKPTLGDPITTLAARHIPAANTLMLATAGLLLAVLLPLRFGAICLWQYWRAVS